MKLCSAWALRLVGISLLLVLMSATGIRAQTESPRQSERPRIGLVLSGGGARGIAHLGVLKVLEELHIPIDAIAGTSMGALVGGLYASGMSPAKMETELSAIDWTGVISDAPTRQDISFRRTEDQYDPLFALELGWSGHRFHLPSGLIAGYQIDFLLRSLVLNTYDTADFDQLPIPFRAVATNLADGSAVVLAGGDLVQTMRASMAIPGAFTPVEINGQILVDGGISRNLPVDVVRAMGVDIVIAVDVGTTVGKLADAPNLLDVVLRTINLLSRGNVIQQKFMLGNRDLLIEPELGSITIADFNRVDEAIAAGEAGTRAKAAELRRLSVTPVAWDAYLARQRRPRMTSLVINRIRFEGNQRVPTALMASRIKVQAGSRLDLKDMKRDLSSIYRIGEFAKVGVQFSRENDGTTMIFHAQEKKGGPGYLRLGLSLTSTLNGEGEFTFLGLYRRALVDRLGGEWRTLVRLGNSMGLATDFYQPLVNSGRWFVDPSLVWSLERRDIFLEDGPVVSVEDHRLQGAFDFGLALDQYGELRAGVYHGVVRTQEFLNEGAPLVNARSGGWRGRFIYDRLDNHEFPTLGTFVEVEALLSRRNLGADRVYDRLDIRLSRAVSHGGSTLLLRGRLAGDLGSEIPFYDQIRIGGLGNVSGLQPGEIQGDNVALGAMTYYRRIGRLAPILGHSINLGLSVETGGAWPSLTQARIDEFRLGNLVFLGMESALGPLYIGWGWADRGKTSAYFQLGRIF